MATCRPAASSLTRAVPASQEDCLIRWPHHLLRRRSLPLGSPSVGAGHGVALGTVGGRSRRDGREAARRLLLPQRRGRRRQAAGRRGAAGGHRRRAADRCRCLGRCQFCCCCTRRCGGAVWAGRLGPLLLAGSWAPGIRLRHALAFLPLRPGRQAGAAQHGRACRLGRGLRQCEAGHAAGQHPHPRPSVRATHQPSSPVAVQPAGHPQAASAPAGQRCPLGTQPTHQQVLRDEGGADGDVLALPRGHGGGGAQVAHILLVKGDPANRGRRGLAMQAPV